MNTHKLLQNTSELFPRFIPSMPRTSKECRQSNTKQDAKPSLPRRASAYLNTTSKSGVRGSIPPALDAASRQSESPAAVPRDALRRRAVPPALLAEAVA